MGLPLRHFLVPLLGLLFLPSGGILTAETSPTHPGRWWLDVNLTSMHSRDTYFYQGRIHEYNARNLGIGVTYDYSSWCSIKAGWFENSYHKNSLYAVVHPHHDFLRSPRRLLAVGLGAGLVTGYDDTVDNLPPISPMAIPTLTISDERRWHVTIGYLPFRLLLGDNHADVLTLQMGFKL